MYWDSLAIAIISYKSDDWWLNFVGLGSSLLHFKLKEEEIISNVNVIASIHVQWKLVYWLDDAENSVNWKLQSHITFHCTICWQQPAPDAKVQKSKPVHERLFTDPKYIHTPSMCYTTHMNVDLWKLPWPYYIPHKKGNMNTGKLLHSLLPPT